MACPKNCRCRKCVLNSQLGCSDVFYTGSNLTGSGINTNDNLCVVIQKLNDVATSTQTYLTAGTCISITGLGSQLNPYVINNEGVCTVDGESGDVILSGTYFKQGGNSFGVAGLLGTNDDNELKLITNGNPHLIVSRIGTIYTGNVIDDNVNKLQIGGSIKNQPPAMLTPATLFYVDNAGVISTRTASEIIDDLNIASVTYTTIYVDSGNPESTDTRAGVNKYSLTQPFLTIGAALSAAASGDIIYVRRGTGSAYTLTATPTVPLRMIIDAASVTFTSVILNIAASDNFISVINRGTLTPTSFTITDCSCRITSDDTGIYATGVTNHSATDQTKIVTLENFASAVGTYNFTTSAVSLFKDIKTFTGVFTSVGMSTTFDRVTWNLTTTQIGAITNLGVINFNRCTVNSNPDQWLSTGVSTAFYMNIDNCSFNNIKSLCGGANVGAQIIARNSYFAVTRHLANIVASTNLVGNNQLINVTFRDSQVINGIFGNCAGNLFMNNVTTNLDYVVPNAGIQPTTYTNMNFVTGAAI